MRIPFHYKSTVFIANNLILVGKSVSLNDLSCICYRYYPYDFSCSHEPCSDIIIVIN